MIIKPNKINTYVDLIVDNKKTFKRIAKNYLMPITSLNVNLSPLGKDDYMSLLDVAGNEQTRVLASYFSKFNSDWVVFERSVLSIDDLKSESKSKDNKLILNIVDCIEPCKIDLNSSEFVEKVVNYENEYKIVEDNLKKSIPFSSKSQWNYAGFIINLVQNKIDLYGDLSMERTNLTLNKSFYDLW